MNIVKFGDRYLNFDLVTHVLVDSEAKKVRVYMSNDKLVVALDEAADLLEWLDSNSQPLPPPEPHISFV